MPEIEEGDGFSPTYDALCYVPFRVVHTFLNQAEATISSALGLKVRRSCVETIVSSEG